MSDKKSLTLARPDEVLQQIRGIKTALSDSLFDLAELLSETKNEAYYQDWGYDSFGEWIETSGLDMSKRQADYFIGIVEKSRALGITRDQLKLATATKLKQIFRLNAETQGEDIKRLVVDAATTPLQGRDGIENQVERVIAGNDREPTCTKSFKFTLDAYENTVKAAIELMQQEYGDTINSSGEVCDITPGRALEMICADYMAGGSHTNEVRGWS